jgi:hypothetical protein
MNATRRLQIDQDRAGLAGLMAAYALRVDAGAVFAETRGQKPIAEARQLAMYLTHVSYAMSLARVARVFGRDRSTVSHACHLIEDRRDDPDFDHMVARLEEALRVAPGPSEMTRCVQA